MDFIRKNWSRLSLAFLFLIGGVISVIAWINNPNLDTKDWMLSFYNTALLISSIVFFFGMVGVTVMKSIPNSKKIVSIVYMSMGGIISVLYLILIAVLGSNDGADYFVFFGDFGVQALYNVWVPFLVFGLHPLIKGVTRFIEAETVPAQATVQPVAETAPAAAPKATARKTAPKTPAAK